MALRIAHNNTDYLVRFLAVLDLQKNGIVGIRHIKHPATRRPFSFNVFPTGRMSGKGIRAGHNSPWPSRSNRNCPVWFGFPLSTQPCSSRTILFPNSWRDLGSHSFSYENSFSSSYVWLKPGNAVRRKVGYQQICFPIVEISKVTLSLYPDPAVIRAGKNHLRTCNCCSSSTPESRISTFPGLASLCTGMNIFEIQPNLWAFSSCHSFEMNGPGNILNG